RRSTDCWWNRTNERGNAMSAQNTGLRLTTRGRQAVRLLRTLLIAAVVIGGALLLATQSFSAAAVAEPEAETIGIDAEEVAVDEVQSLWAVASDLDLDRDPRDVVADLAELHHLPTPAVHPGQALDVPVRCRSAGARRGRRLRRRGAGPSRGP